MAFRPVAASASADEDVVAQLQQVCCGERGVWLVLQKRFIAVHKAADSQAAVAAARNQHRRACLTCLSRPQEVANTRDELRGMLLRVAGLRDLLQVRSAGAAPWPARPRVRARAALQHARHARLPPPLPSPSVAAGHANRRCLGHWQHRHRLWRQPRKTCGGALAGHGRRVGTRRHAAVAPASARRARFICCACRRRWQRNCDIAFCVCNACAAS